MQIIRKIVILGLFLGFTQPVSAEPGSTGAAFLKIGIGARALGMGGAFVGIADDVSALYWNPAGVSQLSQKEVLFAHNALSQDIGQSFLGYVHPLRKRNIGVGLNGLTVGGIEGRENEHSSPENLEAKFSAIILNYSQKVTSNLRIGLNGKVIADNLDGDKQKAFALDLGLLYPRGSLTIGASLNNLGSQLGGADLPTEIKVGLAYRLLKDKLTLVASLDGGEQTRFHLGGEYLLFDRFALRGGLCANDGQSDLGEGTGLSLGLGVRFSSFKLDYALLPYGDMGSTHRISLGAKFGDGETGKARKPFMRAKEGRTKRIAILNFANDTGKLEFDWLIKTIPNLLTTELANSAYLAIIDPDRVEKLIKEGLDEEEIAGKIKTDILVKGSFAISGKTFRIDAKAIDAESSVLLVACSVEGSANKLFDLVYDLAWQLDRKLFLKLNPGVEEASYKPPVGVGKALAHLPDLSIEKVEIANIFPSKYNYYADNPIGKIILKNNTSQNFSSVKVRINIPKFMGLPSEVQVNEVLANSTKEVPLKVALDNDRLLEINENTPTPVEIKAIYYKQGKEEEIALTKSVVFFDRNSIDWDNPASLAAFATPKDDVVKTFSRKVLGSVRIEETGLPVRILQAAAIFEALSLYPLTYISDPSSSFRGEVFDYVQYPSETLEFKSGDCDDFTVLYASMLENIGIQTKLVNTTSHVFLLFDSGITKKNSYLVSLKEEDFVLIEDRVFIPVETTKVGSPFIQAWKSGVEEYGRWQITPGEISLIDLHLAWQTYPPMALTAKTKEVKIPEAAQLLASLKEDDKQFRSGREDVYLKTLAGLTKETAAADNYNRIGMLHFYMGKNEEAEETIDLSTLLYWKK